MDTRLITILITTFLCIFRSNNLYAEQLSYTKLSDNDLAIPTAQTIYKEDGKYLWIGTTNGVYKFNGYNFKHYSNVHESVTINDPYTNHIQMDTRGNLWALTNTGIELYDKKEDTFKLLSQEKEVYGSYFSSCLIHDGVLFSGQNKIALYSYETNQLTLFKKFDNKDEEYNFMFIFNLDDNHIILSHKNYILKINIKSGLISQIPCPSTISSIFVDNQKRIWVGSYDKTLSCFDCNGTLIKTFTPALSSLSNELILSIEQQDSLLWIGTDGGGINILNTYTNEIKVIKHIQGNYQSFPSNSINCLYRDNSNTIWAGTVRDGIVAIKRSSIHSYVEASENNKYGLSNPTILSLYQEEDKDYMWIGTDGEGINKLDLNSRTFTHYPSTKGLKVVSIAKYNENSLLIYVYTKGIFVFNTRTGQLKPLKISKEQLKSVYLMSRLDINFYNISPNTLLALTNKVYKYNTELGTTKEIPFQKQEGTHVILPVGLYNKSFFCHNEAAIYYLNDRKDTLETVFKASQTCRIQSATIDKLGNIWMATNHGIQYFSLRDKKTHLINNNLIKNVTSVIADKKGRIWMGKGDKIFAFVDSTKTLSTFGATDGVIPNEYIEKSHYITNKGDIILGGNKGLTIIDADFEFKTKEIPSIILTEMKIDHLALNEYELSNVGSYKIPAGCKSLEIQVATIEKDILRPKIYKYEIKGDNEQTIESYSPTLRINTFVAGKSTVYASCSTRSGEWSEPHKIISLIFMPPWYKTNWFYGISLVLLVTIIIGIVASIFRRKENKLRFALEEKEKSIYKEKVEFLININHELRTPLTLISGPLRGLLQVSPVTSPHYEVLKKINHQASRMKKLLNMVLDLRKMEVSEKTLDIQSHEVNKWMKNIIDDFTFTENFSDYLIQTDFNDNVGVVNFDADKCEIILSNLLINAIKHSSKDCIILIKSEITTDNMLTISVSDQGKGLTGIDYQKLFNRFYQGNDEKNGSGIGLSYAKLLVDLHKGSIGAYNNVTQGATFYFKIPLNLEINKLANEKRPYLNELFTSKDIDRVKEDGCNLLNYQTDKKTILIVDDNMELTDYIKENFKPKFEKVFTACNGNEALDIIRNNSIDIIVSDIMMPGMDGYELCNTIKNNLEYSHIPVILLTAMNEEICKKLGYKMGADAYISKPFEIDTLYEIIKSKLKIREDIKHKYMQFSVIPEPLEDTFSQIDESFLIQLNKIIVENISDSKLDIPFVCKEIGMSRASLYKKLKALTDMSCNEYINKIRLERAMNLIITTNKTFLEIADETGFANSRYFSTIIKQHTGMTPTQYRKQEKEKKSQNKM